MPGMCILQGAGPLAFRHGNCCGLTACGVPASLVFTNFTQLISSPFGITGALQPIDVVNSETYLHLSDGYGENPPEPLSFFEAFPSGKVPEFSNCVKSNPPPP